MNFLQKQKRKKSSIFSKEDEIRLLNRVYLERNLVENKETNKVTNAEKDKAWERITKSYNADALEHRNMEQLKSKFDNLKTKTRKFIAQERAHLNGTGGGGPLPPINDLAIQLVLKIINLKTVVGLGNRWDSDYNINDKEERTQNEEETLEDFELQNTLCVDTSDNGFPPYSMSMSPIEPLQTLNNSEPHVVCLGESSKSLKDVQVNIQETDSPVKVSSLAVAKEDYYKKISLLAEGELKLRQEEMRIKQDQDKRDDETHKKNMILKDLEIEMKKAELKKMGQ